MGYEQLILLAPCHGLEDFPLYHTGDDAASLLACWTSLWHPLLLDSSQSLPHIQRCDYPPDDLSNALLILPKTSESEMDSELPNRVADQSSKLIRGLHQRTKILKEALEPYGERARLLDPDLVRDFLAFGFAFLQVEVLTQQMRYASSIDQTRVARAIKEAAAAAIAGNAEDCRDKLTVCHDALADERNHYYPVDVYLLDLTLLAETSTTLGQALNDQLENDLPQNFLASGRTIEMLADINAEALASLRHSVESGSVSLAGGEFEELALPLLSVDTFIHQLKQGSESYRTHLGQLPSCFARRKHGLYPALAEIVRYAGYSNALHIKLDAGRLPESSQSKSTWTSGGRELLECFARVPLDASAHDTFLNLPSHLSETMDTDHVATRMFVHWPGHVAPWYEDLRRCAKYGAALGRFVTLDEFFSESSDTSTSDEFLADDYVYPFLKQAIQRGEENPISRWPEYWVDAVARSAQSGCEAIAGALALGASVSHSETENKHAAGRIESDSTNTNSYLLNSLASIRQSICLPESESKGLTVVNPFSFSRRILVHSDFEADREKGSVYATARREDGKVATLVDVPSMGFASLHYRAANTRQSELELVEDLTLRNEYFQATIDPHTGALRALKDYQSRKTRLSQQLAFRMTIPKTGQHWVDRQAPVAYSVMAADSVNVRKGHIQAAIDVRGRLLAPNGDEVGQFKQRYQARRGSRVLMIDVELEVVPELMFEDPWDSYYACRFAFGDETAILQAGSLMQSYDASRRRFVAPLYVNIDSGEKHTTILTGGIPYHRRAAASQLDTLLAVRGETAKRFRLGIGVDLPVRTRSGIDFIAGCLDTPSLPAAAKSDSGWLFHIDAKNVVVPWWQALENNEGIRLRLIETENRKSTVKVQSSRPWQQAHLVNIHGDVLKELTVHDGIAEYTAHPHSFAELKLMW